MVRRAICYFAFCVGAIDLSAAGGQERWVETVLPSLDYSPTCWSTVALQNLGSRLTIVEIEAHSGSGALVPLVDQREMTVRLLPGARTSYTLQLEEDTSAWVKVRERIAAPALSAVVAVSGKTECLVGNELRTAARAAAYPTLNAWFSEEVSEARRTETVLLINTSEHTAVAWVCYSSGSFFTLPANRRPPEFVPLCSTAFDVQVPPFGSHLFPLDHHGNSQFSLRTRGTAIVLQMLRQSDPAVKLYTVDSSITFGGEVPVAAPRP